MTLEAALAAVRNGLEVFPCHGVVEDKCTCEEPNCASAGKHPHTFHGVKDATTDPGRVEAWWKQWPDANVALACGPRSGVFVIDIDPRNGGFESIEEYEINREEGPLPPTRTAVTGGGGRHLFYRWPDDGPVPGRASWLPGVDVKGDGGYVILPPGTHTSGRRYEWFNDLPLANPPADLVGALRAGGRSTGRPELPSAREILDGVPEGQRDDVLFRHACQLRRKGYDLEHVKLVILEAARNCAPPFPEDVATRKVEQAWKYRSDEDHLPLGSHSEDLRNFTDDGNARRLVDIHGEDFRWVEAWGWVTWNETHWIRGQPQLVTAYARDTVQAMYAEAETVEDPTVRRELAKWAFKSESASKIQSMLTLAKSDARVASHVESFDADPWLVNCRNGVLDLRTGELRPPNRGLLLTKRAGCDYDPDAGHPRWDAFLDRIIPDPEVRAFIQRVAGYSLTGVTREKAVFILHGSGQNGKTAFLETVRGVWGDYAAGTPSGMLVNRRNDAIPTDLARLQGIRLATASETEEGNRLATSFVKEITGGDKITARFMRQDFFEFTPEFKLWLGTNHVPVVGDFGDAMWRRLRLIPFEVRIPDEEKIPLDNYVLLLLQEASGILNWAVDGCKQWQAIGMAEPERVRTATDTYREEMDWFQEFLDENVEVSTDVTSSRDLYLVFREWAVIRGDMKPWSIGSFTRQLQQRDYQMGRTTDGQRGFYAKRKVAAHVI